MQNLFNLWTYYSYLQNLILKTCSYNWLLAVKRRLTRSVPVLFRYTVVGQKIYTVTTTTTQRMWFQTFSHKSGPDQLLAGPC